MGYHFTERARTVHRIVHLALIGLLAVACSKEDGGVTGSEPKEILDDVQQQLDAASAVAEDRLEEAMDKIDSE